ncbi:12807_t:CDS:2 [Acaulospora colombiana]|uniref:12807_t:CDS:1 n=1 Tax=Acaulospora colombiana TaxID=27376 RepID=A0ACA9LHV5_9GLOM|nr:12807_t:CDS:2 [Acaulospora colombiana]
MFETSQAFQTELIVFSSSYEKQLLKHVEWLLQELTSWKSRKEINNLSSPSVKRKKELDDEPSYDENPARKIQRLISPQTVQIKATNSEIEQRINAFIQLKKSEINDSNRAEFLRKSSSDDVSSCARSDAAEINRNIQMKFDVVNNNDGPLARSTFSSKNQINDGKKRPLTELPSGVEERLQNIEKHLGVNIVAPIPLDVYARIKILEAKIIQIEQDHPQWAAVNFNQPNRQVISNHQKNCELAYKFVKFRANNINILKLQFPPPPHVTTIPRNSNSELANSVAPENLALTSTINIPPIPNPAVDGKQISSQQNLKFSRAPRPIKPKGRGHGDFSLTRSIMEQLKMRRESDNKLVSATVTNVSTELSQQENQQNPVHSVSNVQPPIQTKVKGIQSSDVLKSHRDVTLVETVDQNANDQFISSDGDNNEPFKEINARDVDVVTPNVISTK